MSNYKYASLPASGRKNTEDRAVAIERGDSVVIVVADGAGGIRGGAAASDALVIGVTTALAADPFDTEDGATRLTNWADRRNVTTLGELARRTPSALLTERNLGRKSIKEARSLIETATGRRWEDLIERNPEAAPGPTASLESGLLNWDQARVLLSDEQKGFLLEDMELPAIPTLS